MTTRKRSKGEEGMSSDEKGSNKVFIRVGDATLSLKMIARCDEIQIGSVYLWPGPFSRGPLYYTIDLIRKCNYEKRITFLSKEQRDAEYKSLCKVIVKDEKRAARRASKRSEGT